MNTATTGISGFKPLMLGARIVLGLAATLTVALTLIVINLAGSQESTAFAATHTSAGSKNVAVSTEVAVGEESEMTEVWCATLTVGYNADSRITYLGYTPALSPSGGSLDETAFTYEDVDYTVESLFYQEFAGTVRQVVLEANQQLPDELVLQLGGDEFSVADSLVLGANENIHAWWLDTSIGWTEGQTVEVAMMAPRHQESVDLTLQGDRTIPVNGSLDGEITGPNGLDQYQIAIEDDSA